MSDLTGDDVQERSGGRRFRAGQMPHLADGSVIGAERGQTGSDVRDIAVGVRQVGIAEEVRAFAGDGVGEHACAERRFGDAGTEEIRCAADRDADPTRIRLGL